MRQAGLPKAIDIYEPGGCALWALRLGITEEELKVAVRFVGVELDAVRLYLSQFPLGAPAAAWPADRAETPRFPRHDEPGNTSR